MLNPAKVNRTSFLMYNNLVRTTTITCLIPFFNEHAGIIRVLDEIIKIKSIAEIVLIDDGSTDKTESEVKRCYPNLPMLRNKTNLGKSEAIVKGLTQAKGQYILLLDADLYNVQPNEIENGINAVKKDANIDMIIFNRRKASLLVRLLRGAILTSGQRIIKKELLSQILSLYKPKGYQIEVALNQYAMDKQKRVFWMPLSIVNTPSTQKRGLTDGIKKIILMHIAMLQYLGINNTIKQLLFFCRKEYKHHKL